MSTTLGVPRMARSGGVFIHDGIGPVLGYLFASAAENVADAMYDGKGAVEAYAQSNAPWADQTGAARAGLTASVDVDGGEVVLELAHSVDYGYWLEVIQDGTFAIIMPTLEALGPEIIREAGGKVISVGSSF